MCICAAPRTPPEGVTIYGDSNARDFRQLKSFFEDRGVLFDHADSTQSSANQERMLSLSGQQQAAVVEIGKNIFIGFTPDAIEQVLP
jgi:arsenate reductase-like glutaredoxin family protein